jgi:hypothetical protein
MASVFMREGLGLARQHRVEALEDIQRIRRAFALGRTADIQIVDANAGIGCGPSIFPAVFNSEPTPRFVDSDDIALPVEHRHMSGHRVQDGLLELLVLAEGLLRLLALGDVADHRDDHRAVLIRVLVCTDLCRDAPAILGDQRFLMAQQPVIQHSNILSNPRAIFRREDVEGRQVPQLLWRIAQQRADCWIDLKEMTASGFTDPLMHHNAIAGQVEKFLEALAGLA